MKTGQYLPLKNQKKNWYFYTIGVGHLNDTYMDRIVYSNFTEKINLL